MTDPKDELVMAMHAFKERQDAEINEAIKVAMKAFWDHVGDTDLIYHPLQPLQALLTEVDRQTNNLFDQYASYGGPPGEDGVNWQEEPTGPVEPGENDIEW